VDASLPLRVRVEIMGSYKCRIAGKSQSVLMMINPIIFRWCRCTRGCGAWARPCSGPRAGSSSSEPGLSIADAVHLD
jgi:hypothetical protein